MSNKIIFQSNKSLDFFMLFIPKSYLTHMLHYITLYIILITRPLLNQVC